MEVSTITQPEPTVSTGMLNPLTINNELVIDSREVAISLDIEHKNLLSSIRKYTDKINTFGRVAFETQALETNGGNQQIVFCYLNENQALFVGTLSKNTEKVIDFKMQLIDAFSKARQMLNVYVPSYTITDPIARAKAWIAEQEQALHERAELARQLDHKQSIVLELTENIPDKTLRIKINEIVRAYAKNEGVFYNFIWRRLYKEFKAIYHIDLSTRAKNKNQSIIDIAESLGQLENLYTLALKTFEI
jgi:phage regulator Rha-like protein